MWGTKGDTQGHWGQTHLTGIALSVRCLRDHHRLQWGEPERPAGRQLGVREGRGLGSPGDWVMWDWGAARTEEMKISKNWRWFVGCPWKLKGLRGDTEVPLGIEGIWGRGVPPGCPQGPGLLWPLTICRRSSRPSQPPCAQRSPARRGGSALAAPSLQLHCGGTVWGAVGRHCASQHGPSLIPPVLHMAPILPLPPTPTLEPPQPQSLQCPQLYALWVPIPVPWSLILSPPSTPSPNLPCPHAFPASSIFNPAPFPLPGILQPKPLGHLEIQLNGATLVMPPQCILDPDIDLQKGKAARVAFPTLTYVTQQPQRTITGP